MIRYIPADTLNYIRNNSQIENFALSFQKFVTFGNDLKPILFKANQYDVSRFNHFHKVNLTGLINELKNSAKALFGNNNFFETNLQISWRLAIGLGSESVYETSMNLHPVYGIPYIPGQAIKGVTRSWMIQELFHSKEEEAFKDKTFCLLFGSDKSGVQGESQGSVIFYDAYPIALDMNNIKVDVMNPHYGDYYSKGKAPADYFNPIPIFFLTIVNTSFKFIIGVSQKDNLTIDNPGKFLGKTILEVAQKWMLSAMQNHGIGAKTASGYGYF